MLWPHDTSNFETQYNNKNILQGVSLILTLLKCKISGQKISNFFQTKLFFIVNFRTFCVIKTKFKNIYQFGRYSDFCESTQFVERYFFMVLFFVMFQILGNVYALWHPKSQNKSKTTLFIYFKAMPGHVWYIT